LIDAERQAQTKNHIFKEEERTAEATDVEDMVYTQGLEKVYP
jgi:hypothetical protein